MELSLNLVKRQVDLRDVKEVKWDKGVQGDVAQGKPA